MALSAVTASRSPLKAAHRLTRNASHFFQTSTPTEFRATASSTTKTTATETMANVEVRQQTQPFQSTISSLQAPLPRQLSHCTTLRRPIPNSYFATPWLLATEYPWAPSTPRPKLDALLAAGVRTFIDLTESGELLGYSQLLPVRAHSCGLSPSETHTIEYFRFPIPDRKCPESSAFLARILSVLYSCEQRGRIGAVHCRGGIGRTGTVVGCWLVQSGRVRDGAEALQVIAQQWATVEKHTRYPCSPETGAQVEFVRNFKRLPVSTRDGEDEADEEA